ncbi:peptidylprolyl isomerase [Kribbella sp. NPDC051770]|uniref:peptidylprolyl isomerase n=1 Tax=Kribbella sp. NPDC051770 TaxID=3155413 RepID=UPI00341C3D90
MRQWQRVVAIVVVATLVFALEGWIASAAPPFFGKCSYNRTGAPAPVRPPYSLAPTMGVVKATVTTTAGAVELRLDRDNAPCAVHSFGHLALGGFYTGAPCGRLTPLLLECGPAEAGFRYPAELTGKEKYPRGTVAMVPDGAGQNGPRFFFVHHDAPLPPVFTVVGRVVAGMDVIDRVAATGCGPGEQPKTPVSITGVTIG